MIFSYVLNSIHLTYIPKFGYKDFSCQRELRCTLFQTLIIFVKLWLISFQSELSGTGLPKFTPITLIENYNNIISPVLSIVFSYDPAHKAWLFKKFIFELEASHSLKITFILLMQVLSPNKNGGAIGKMYCLISWFPICTPLILVSTSMKIASTSATVICNSMRVDTPGKLFM